MLDNTLLQLANANRRMRLDAYSTLWSAFKAYAVLPDSHITKGKVQALLEFLKNDLTHEIGSPMEPAETNLVLQALKLLVTLVWTKSLSVHLTDTYRSFVIDHSTRIIEERKVSKAVLLHYMHLLSTQDFSSKFMTAARAVRLLEVLKDLPDHVRGNGVISERLMVYQRISEQAKGTFKSRPSCWVSQLLFAMTCSISDTRKKAIAWGNRLPVALGASSTVATALRDLFDSPGEQEDVLSSTICKRLMKMMKSVNEARQVPQIWAVVMLLMRGLNHKFHEWHRLPDWLRIIQKCFNCSDSEARLEANKAWNKLVYVAQPQGENGSFLTKMLMKPLLVQMERPSSEKHSKSTRNSAFASYCNLLYYAWKPSASFRHNDAVWDEYIVPAFKMPFLSSEHNSDSACRILMALFWREKLNVWKETRALDATPIEPEELPLLDCKWIRSRTTSILEVFELLFRSSNWGPALYPDTAYVAFAWRNFAKALGDACRKEVRASPATTEAVTHITQFLIRFCQNSIATNKEANESYVSRFHFLCKTILEDVGPLLFAERATECKSKGRPPMIDILEALQNLPSSFKDEIHFNTVSDLLQLTSKAPSSANSRIHFYKQCAEVVMHGGSGDVGSRLTWKVIAKLVTDDMKTATTFLGDSGDAEHTVANIVRILELAVPYQKGECVAWSTLLKESLLVSKSHQTGFLVTDQLGARLSHHLTDEGSLCAALLVQDFLGFLNSSSSSTNRKPFSKRTELKEPEAMSTYRRLVELIDLHLSRMYGLADCGDEVVLHSIINAAISLLHSCPTEYKLACLTRMQQSLGLWLEDEQRLLTTASSAGHLKLVQARKLCPFVIDVLGELSKKMDLKALDSLFAAAFRTSHTTTINLMVQMWNSDYGTSKNLEYGEMLKVALARLVPFVDLEPPGLHDLDSQRMSPPKLEYIEDPEMKGGSDSHQDSAASSEIGQPMHLLSVVRETRERPCETTDAAGKRMPMKEDFRARLHHNDSQVQFVPIESSPLPGENTESQDLTARQKEVRERQDRESALHFPDLRSSSSSRGMRVSKTAKESPSLPPADEDGALGIAHPGTPSLSSRKIMSYQEAAQCSPTPKSKQQALRFEEIDAPSSPLSLHDPVEGSIEQPEAAIHSDCRNEIRSEAEDEELIEFGLFEDNSVESSILDDVDDALSPCTERSCTALPVKESYAEEKQTRQTSPNNLAAKSDNRAQDEVVMILQVGDGLSSADVTAKGHGAEIDICDKLVNDVQPLRRFYQGPEIVAPLPATENTLDVEMTNNTPQTDGSNEDEMESNFETTTNADSPLVEQKKIYSDYNDFWSASQLSQELERAASSAPSQSRGEHPDPDPAFSSPAKRKWSSVASQRSKRRKTTGDSARPAAPAKLSSTTPDVHISEDIYDCIEVQAPASSSRSIRAASIASHSSVVSQPPKRARGRPRRVQSLLELPGPSGNGENMPKDNISDHHESNPQVEVRIPTSSHRTNPSQPSPESDVPPSQRQKHDPDDSPRIPNPTTSSDRDHSSGPQPPCTEPKPNNNEGGDQPLPPEEAAMTLLQKALSSLRNSKTGLQRADLRAIDDLVFEIRTEAQNAALRNAPTEP
jgi:Rap1-interacting factor 1 N terminal